MVFLEADPVLWRSYDNLICKCVANLSEKIHAKVRNDFKPFQEALKKDAKKPLYQRILILHKQC